ncbi:large ribosomal subunit protein bL19m-like [Styela clava]
MLQKYSLNLANRICKNSKISAFSVILRQFESTFVAPERPTLKSRTDASKRASVEGREDPEIFSPEYVPRQVLPEWHRNNLKYRLERMDCLRRRQNIDIPEFYPGSIVRVTVADQYAQEKVSKFAGRVLYRDGFGMDCHFCLRNILDGEAVEIIYQLYSPIIQKIEVLRLEKWIDTDLRYLRDASDSSICTIDLDMIPEAILPPSEKLPVFEKKIKMRPWKRWNWKYHRSWPQPQNAYLNEHFVEEELIMNEKYIDLHSWRKFDICRHHDFIQEKKDIMEEMKVNKLRIRGRRKRGNTR